ncbi:MAG: hypothetical protein QW056_00410 [Candidatus Bathyarchaeia archaeon]
MQRKPDKSERAELYKDRRNLVFLSKFISGEIGELQPVFEPKAGYRYPVVEEILEGASGVGEFLNRLYEVGILKRRLYDKVIYCPHCGSHNVSTHYCCPYCRSFNIKKDSLIEHVKCGYIGIEENFRVANKLICPKCRMELKNLDLDYRRAGIWCTCKECGKSFDIPVPRHFCRDCQSKFAFEDSETQDVYAYSLNEEVRGEIEAGWIFVAPIREFLKGVGFEVEAPAFLRGRSGANHMFDLVATMGAEKKCLMVMDVATSPEGLVPEQPIIALFAKVFDVSPDIAYLIAIPKLNENGKKMAELYKINIIEAKDAKEITTVLKEKLAVP